MKTRSATIALVAAMLLAAPSVVGASAAADPARFAEPREEHKRHKFAWLPFGGGAHTCLGLQFSRLEMAAFMVRLLRRYRDARAAHRLPTPRGYGRPGIGRAVFSVSSFMDVLPDDVEVPS